MQSYHAAGVTCKRRAKGSRIKVVPRPQNVLSQMGEGLFFYKKIEILKFKER